MSDLAPIIVTVLVMVGLSLLMANGGARAREHAIGQSICGEDRFTYIDKVLYCGTDGDYEKVVW